jgi:hypothetical protein
MTQASSRRLVSDAAASSFSKPAVGSSFPASPACGVTLAEEIGPRPLNPQQELFRAILLGFSDAAALPVDRLAHLPRRKWRHLLHWLDISGMALYFLDRITQLEMVDTLPQFVLERLQQNLRDNTLRTRGMIEESVAIQCDFQEAAVRYAVMKGVSLTPASVPRPELRHQFDLDYLVAEKSAPAARQILERRGYRLFAISGTSWEFKIHETPHVSMKDLYKDLTYRAVELHLESEMSAQDSRLDRVVNREMFGLSMPVLSPVDLFLGQGMHAFKDVCSAFSRAAHLLEFYRHVLARKHDDGFWSELRARAEDDRRICFSIGVVTELMTSIMGEFAPERLTVWTVEKLPASTGLWIELYGDRGVFGKDPGTKLYLLLQKELGAAGIPGKRPLNRSLWPLRLPPPVVRRLAGETLSTTVARYRIQARFILSRVRFHVVEGLRYAMESYRWRQYLDRLS